MQILLDEKIVQISVYLEKLQLKETDHRKLYIQLAEEKQRYHSLEGSSGSWKTERSQH